MVELVTTISQRIYTTAVRLALNDTSTSFVVRWIDRSLPIAKQRLIYAILLTLDNSDYLISLLEMGQFFHRGR